MIKVLVGEYSRSLLESSRNLLESRMSLLESSRSLLKSSRSLLESSRSQSTKIKWNQVGLEVPTRISKEPTRILQVLF